MSKKIAKKPSKKTSKKVTKKATGRPSKYTPAIQKKADKYIRDFELFEKYTVQKVVGDRVLDIELQRPSGIPSIASIAIHLNIHRETIYNWAKDHDRFFDTLEDLRKKQEQFLEYHGLTKGYDSAFAKFIAVNTTGYRDKVESKEEVNTTINMAYKLDE